MSGDKPGLKFVRYMEILTGIRCVGVLVNELKNYLPEQMTRKT